MADARPPELELEMRAPTGGILVAQQLSDLSESELRRLMYYSTKVVDALTALAVDDANASDAVTSARKIASVRASISRLIDAGARSGYSVEDVADYFQFALQEQFTQEVPSALLDASGNIDTRSLFAGVFAQSQATSQNQGGGDYLALLDQASQNLAPLVGQSDSATVAPDQVVQPAAQNPGPPVLPGASATIIAIVERIQVRGNEWVIEVGRGDSLGQYSSAIYGDTLSYQRIYEANRDQLANPNTIELGMIIRLPKP